MGPETAIRRQGINQATLLKYPDNIGSDEDGLQHFMLITEYQFKKNTNRVKDPLTDFSDFTESNRFYESKNAFALYLPKGSIKTQYSASHEKVDFGFFGALLNAESSDILARLQAQLPGVVSSDQNALSKSMDFYKTIGTSVYNELKPSIEQYDFKTKFGFNIGEAVGALVMGKDKSAAVASLSMRKSGNPFSTLVFSGVKERRQHAFAFDFYPRNSVESDRILTIIKRLKRGMLPGLKKSGSKQTMNVKVPRQSFGIDESADKTQASLVTVKKTVDTSSSTGNVLASAFFDYPSVYKIGFYKKDGDRNQFIHQIGQSSILNLKVTYGEGGQQVFFKDTGAPQHIKLDLTFKENFALSRNFVKQLEGA